MLTSPLVSTFCQCKAKVPKMSQVFLLAYLSLSIIPVTFSKPPSMCVRMSHTDLASRAFGCNVAQQPTFAILNKKYNYYHYLFLLLLLYTIIVITMMLLLLLLSPSWLSSSLVLLLLLNSAIFHHKMT